jgi:hypothetical protein
VGGQQGQQAARGEGGTAGGVEVAVGTGKEEAHGGWLENCLFQHPHLFSGFDIP